MTKKNITPSILMFAPSCYPPGNPEAFVNANLAQAALDAGWDLDVISMPDMTHWYPNDLSAWQAIATCSVNVAARQKTFINRLIGGLEGVIRSGHLVGGMRWALPAASEGLRLVRAKKYDYIISRALPSEGHLAALMVAKKTEIPWIANWNDPVPWDKFPAPYGRGSAAPLGYWDSKYYSEIAEKAVWHTFPCERLRNYISGYLPRDIKGKSSVIPHIALGKNDPASTGNKTFTLMHAGSLRPPRSPENFLRGIKLFLDQVKPNEGVLVVFIVDRPEEVASAAKANGVENMVQIEPSRPYTEMPSALAKADILVIIEAQVAEGIFLPSKFVDYVRTGRPILAISPAVGTLADILDNNGGGLAVDGANPEAVAAAVTKLFCSWRTGRLDAEFSSSRLYSKYCSKTILENYLNLFFRLAANIHDTRLNI